MKLSNRTFSISVALAAAVGLAASQAFAEDTAKERQDLIKAANTAIDDFKKTDPEMSKLFVNAPGYVVFPNIGKGAVLVGGGGGSGVLFENGKPMGKATVSQLTVGLQVGGQSYSEVIFFETPKAVSEFKKGNTALSASASAVVAASGGAVNAKYTEGVAVFTHAKKGLMTEVSVGGQKFSYERFPDTPQT